MLYTAKDLLSIHLFEGLNGDECVQLYEIARYHPLGQNVIVLKEGDTGDSFFAIIKGGIHVTKVIDGANRTLARLSGGDVFGEMALLEGCPRFATVITLEETDLLEFNRKDLDRVFEKFPNIGRHVYRNLSRRLSSKLRNLGENILEINPSFEHKEAS